jgi:hypothetical protein
MAFWAKVMAIRDYLHEFNKTREQDCAIWIAYSAEKGDSPMVV